MLDEQFAASVRRVWNADADGRFPCPLPEHTGMAQVGVTPEDPHEDLRLLCCRGRWRSLGEVRAAEAFGHDVMRSNIEIAIWLRRLAFEAGTFAPVDAGVPPVAPGVADYVQRARDGFSLLLALRWADYEPRPVAFSVRFCSAWCGLGHREAMLALRELQALGVMVKVGKVGRVALYAPGPGGGLRLVPEPEPVGPAPWEPGGRPWEPYKGGAA